MDSSPVAWVDTLATSITTLAVVLLVVVNGGFLLGVLQTRSRAFVDRWTRRVVVADAALVVALVGAPVVALTANLAAAGWQRITASTSSVVTPDAK